MAVARAVLVYIEQRDLRLMRRLHRWRAPRSIRISMLIVSRLGNGWLWYSLGMFILICGGQNRYGAFFAGALSALVAILIFQRVKPFSRRRRPCEIEPHCWAVISPPDRFLSLRSRHDFFRHRTGGRQLLSSMPALPAGGGSFGRSVSHYRRHAFPYRYSCRCPHGLPLWISLGLFL